MRIARFLTPFQLTAAGLDARVPARDTDTAVFERQPLACVLRLQWHRCQEGGGDDG